MTVRDWLDLLVVPLALVVIGFLFTMQQDQRQQAIENQRARQAQKIEEQRAQDLVLQGYLDQMSTLVLEDLSKPKVQTMLQARTLMVLRRLDASRKTEVMRYLAEAALVHTVDGSDPIIGLTDTNLSGIHLPGAELRGAYLLQADLSDAYLSSADLGGAYLIGADLSNANLGGAWLNNASLNGADLSNADLSGTAQSTVLQNANLENANLRESDLRDAGLSGAALSDANLSKADLGGANLSKADLSGANLSRANLSGVVLEGADLNEADLRGATGITAKELSQQAKFLNSATLPNGQKFEDWLLPAGKFSTYEFEPAFHFEVGENWDENVPETTDALYLGTGPNGGQLLFTNPRHVFGPNKPSEPKELPAPENVAEWVSWFQSHPNLDTSKPVPVSVGGASGKRIDVTHASAPENHPWDVCGDRPCVPLYPISESSLVSYDGWKYRFIILDVGTETLIIDVAAPEDKFDAFSPKAQKVLDTVEWSGSE